MKQSFYLIVFVLFFATFFLFNVSRASSPGVADKTFNSTGYKTIDFSPNDPDAISFATAIARQSNGKLIIAGHTFISGLPKDDFALARLNTDGTLDTTFGTGGRVLTDFPIQNVTFTPERIYGLAIQADGKIIAVGGYEGMVGSNSANMDFKLARYNSDGTLDATFGTGGRVSLDFFGGVDIANDIIILSDGKLMVGGTVRLLQNDMNTHSFALARFNSDGSLDTTFGQNGKVVSSAFTSDKMSRLLQQPDGKFVAAGTGITDFAIQRYNSDGTLDTTFGNNGRATTTGLSLWTGNDRNIVAILQSDGKILVGSGSGLTLPVLVRFNSNGSKDTNFGTNGVANPYSGVIKGIALQPDGKIIIANYLDSFLYPHSSVSRLLSNGSLDSSFAYKGTRAYGNSKASAMIQQPDGKIVTVGYTGSGKESSILRFQMDATPPSKLADFDGDGKTDISIYRPSSSVWYIFHSSDSSIRIEQYGISTDKPMPRDYNGDKKTDLAVMRRQGNNLFWYLWYSDSPPYNVVNYGINGDMLVNGDFDGDGRDDLAVFRLLSGWWYSTGYDIRNTYIQQSFGDVNDKPAPADFDGDGNADFTYFRPSTGTWSISKTLGGTTSVQWGLSGDIPVPGDYDGDGKADVAIYRPSNGTWWILKSSDGGLLAYQWGLNSDVPVPGDYDGDNKTDIGIWRPDSGIWYILQSSTQSLYAFQWGTDGDVPIPSTYLAQ